MGEPYHMFLNMSIINLPLEDYFVAQKPDETVSGTMNGTFTLKGPIRTAILAGHFDVQKGILGTLRFDSIIINLKGKGPVVSLYDSRIRKEDGYIILDGEADLSKLKEKKAFKSVFLGPGNNFFVWDGWSVTKANNDSSVSAEKFIEEDFKVSFKARTKDKESEEERFFGVEHKTKF